ncbi:hypothetical protein R1flu_022021 [Riccia fluitans]|uniref:Uncharacterized protein n=1 Tax=Riccia fluitans TaxID=41844 RepID=A0ABD1ZR00_9MARC
MKPHKMREVSIMEVVRRTTEEEEDDDNATLQECLDRQKKVSKIGTKRKIFAPNPLYDENHPSPRNGARKRSKGILELLGLESPSTPPSRGSKTERNLPENCISLFKEGGKRKRRKKKKKQRRDVEGEGYGQMVLPDGAEFLNSFAEPTEDLTASESSRKFFIRVAKVELADLRRLSSGSAADDLEASAEIAASPGDPEHCEDTFLPGDGYHTCGDAENCPRTPCLGRVLKHLDRMPEEQLKLWYKAIMGEVFCSRNGEKVRGRLRRMIRCRVKELMKDHSSESAISSPSWRSTSTAEQASPSVKSGPAGGSFSDSPGSKMSASNAGDGTVELESGTPSSKITFPAPVSSPLDVSRELNFHQLPASRNSCANETSTTSSVVDPEPPLPLVTPRITRSKTRDLVKRSSTEQDEGPPLGSDLSLEVSAPVALESAGPADFVSHRLSSRAASVEGAFLCVSGKEIMSMDAICKKVGLEGEEPYAAAAAASVHARSLKKASAAEETVGDHLLITAASARSRKKNCGECKFLRDVTARADCDGPDGRLDSAGEEATAVATRSRKKKDLVALGDCNVMSEVAEVAGALETTEYRPRKYPIAPEKLSAGTAFSTDFNLKERLVGGVLGLPSAAATRSRKRREIPRGPSPYDWDENNTLPLARNSELGTCAIRARRKSSAAEKVHEASPSPGDCDLSGSLVVECVHPETPAITTRSRKRKEKAATAKSLSEAQSPAGQDADVPTVELAAPDLKKAADNSQQHNFDVEKDPGEVVTPDDCSVGRPVDDVEFPEVAKTGSLSGNEGKFIVEQAPGDDDTAPEIFVALSGESRAASEKVVTRSSQKSSVIAERLSDSATKRLCNEELASLVAGERSPGDSSRASDGKESSPLTEIQPEPSQAGNPLGSKHFPPGKDRVEVALPALCPMNCVLVEVGAGTTAVAIRSSEKASGTASISASCDLKRPAAENAALESTKADLTSSKSGEVAATEGFLGEICTPSHSALGPPSLPSPAEDSVPDLQQSQEIGDLMDGDVPSLSEVIMRLLSGYPTSSSDFRVEGKKDDGHLAKEAITPQSERRLTAKNTSGAHLSMPRELPSYKHDNAVEDTSNETTKNPGPGLVSFDFSCPAAFPHKEEALICEVSEYTDLRCPELSDVFQSHPPGWGWTCSRSDRKPVDYSVSSRCTFNTQCEEIPVEDPLEADSVPLLTTSIEVPNDDGVHPTDPAEASLQEGSQISSNESHEFGVIGGTLSDSTDEALFEQLVAEKISSLWAMGGEMESLDGDDKGCEVCSPSRCGSRNWQLAKCDSGCAKVSTILSRVEGKDAREYLENSDRMYMMMETEKSLSSARENKRKHYECSIGDDRGRSPADAPLNEYGPSPTRQRVEPEEAGCSAAEEHSVKLDDVCHADEDLVQAEVKDDPSTMIAEGFAASKPVEEPLRSQEHQEFWNPDHKRNGESSRFEDSFSAGALLSPLGLPRVEESHLVDQLPCDSVASQLTPDEDGCLELEARLDACVELLSCEQLVDGDRAEEFDRMTETLVTRKLESLREDTWDDSPSPPQSIPPFRLKLPSGRARHIASARIDPELVSSCEWRDAEARVLEKEPMGTSPTSLSSSSSDDDSADLTKRDAEVSHGAAPSDETSCQKMSLVFSPMSPESSPKTNNCSNILKQGSISSPEVHAPQPAAAKCGKGILKASPKCDECVQLRLQARTASDFVASQMKTFGEVAGRLTREIQELRSILESQVPGATQRLSDDDNTQDTAKAISRSKDTERSAEKNLSLLLRDCKRFCKLTAKRPQRKIVFADEAGKKLCHVKTFQTAPALARPLWDIL